MKLFVKSLALISILLITGCDNDCCQQDVVKESIVVKGNQTPIARITGAPTTFRCGEDINASGLTSSDPDGEVVKYLWTLDGEEISQENGSMPTIPCDRYEHQLCLIVEDNDGQKSIVPTCQTIKADDTYLIIPTNDNRSYQVSPKVNILKIDRLKYMISCMQNVKSDKKSIKCNWVITKHLKYSDSVDIYKWQGLSMFIEIDPSIYDSMEITLTVINQNGSKETITQSYKILDN